MKRNKVIEHALEWALRMGYSHALDAIEAYTQERGLTFEVDYQNLVTYQPGTIKVKRAHTGDTIAELPADKYSVVPGSSQGGQS